MLLGTTKAELPAEIKLAWFGWRSALIEAIKWPRRLLLSWDDAT
jgi:hypothetical protein